MVLSIASQWLAAVYAVDYRTSGRGLRGGMPQCEDLLGLTPLEAHTRLEDIYEAIKEMLSKRGIDLKKVVSVTIDGVPVLLT